MKKATVLCVDDDIKCLECRSFLLRAAGYEVLTADNGSEALVIFAANDIDLTILDYEMPDVDGGVLASRLKGLAPHIPVFMISGKDQLPTEALRSVDQLMSKGEQTETFLSEVSELVAVGSTFDHFIRTTPRARVTHPRRAA
jgi:CheY-like chemotaxis protein